MFPPVFLNSMILLGKNDVSLADTVDTFEKQGLLILDNNQAGNLGSNPFAISKALDVNKIDYDRINSLAEMTEP